MARSGVYYVVKAMERTVAGTATADAPPVPARRADDRGSSSRVRRALAAVQHSLGAAGSAGRSRRRLGGAARAD